MRVHIGFLAILMFMFVWGPGVAMGGMPHDGLHFSHPLIAESPSPDTKLRLDYFYRNLEHDGREHSPRVEMEYAFNPDLSFEIDVPYVFTDPDGQPSQDNLGEVEIGVKMVNRTFEKHGVLVGGGIELGLPTGDDDKGIGSDHVLHVEPFVDVGYKVDQLEIISFLSLGIPTNEHGGEKDEVDLELGFNLALIYRLNPLVSALLEIDGESVVSGHENESVVNITPGVKLRATKDARTELGVGVSLPLTNDQEFDSQVILSLFFHF